MSHDTHGEPKENKSIISFKNSFWLVVIIVGLFIAALNFINAESGNDEESKGEAKTEMKAATEPTGEKAEAPKAAETEPKDTATEAGK